MRGKLISKLAFDGPMAGLMARRMEKGNTDAEREAIETLAPSDGANVLVIGFGPGVGVQLLADRIPSGHIAGVDPSKGMLKRAAARNAGAIGEGRVELVNTTAASLPWPDQTFDGAITVNTIQLWDPFEPSVAEVARVLRPGASLVSFTHDWAIKLSTKLEVEPWVQRTSATCLAHGLIDAKSWRAKAEEGASVAFVVRRP